MKAMVAAGGIGAGPGRAHVVNRPINDELVRRTAYEDAEEEPETPQLHIAVAWATLAGATAIIGLCAGQFSNASGRNCANYGQNSWWMAFPPLLQAVSQLNSSV